MPEYVPIAERGQKPEYAPDIPFTFDQSLRSCGGMY